MGTSIDQIWVTSQDNLNQKKKRKNNKTNNEDKVAVC